MRFLIENMPVTDLQTLQSSYLLTTVSMAYEARDTAPWKAQIPNALFLNDVLPYASLNEARDDSRKLLRDKSLPLIADCKTPAEAAHRLNAKLFPLLNARYSTERKRADQSPLETIASGKATCSGLSILLVDACRAVGVPARVVGTPMWTNLRGNHTWVEIWDGDWHFLGAAEPDEQGLDHGWFTHDASLAKKDMPQHAIYASSFQKTGLAFPLVWAENIRWVPAVNVTDRYTKVVSADASKTRLLVRVLDGTGKRVVAHITLREVGKPAILLDGSSKGETADLNDMPGVDVVRVCPPRHYEVTAEYEGKIARTAFTAGAEAQQVITVRMDAPETVSLMLPDAKAQDKTDKKEQEKIGKIAPLLADRFGADIEKKNKAQKKLVGMKAEKAECEAAWQAYKTSPAWSKLRQEWEQKTVTTPNRTSPYLWRHVGEKPADGWALVIAMHGGGNAPKAVNDREWQYMFEKYYKDHPEAGGYAYLALRAPNDEWNGFYDDAICPLVERLIQQFVLFDDVNPDKVYTLGASHGGYGAFVIGPKIPYRFAAIHAAASAPTDGETMGENLRNVPFTITTGAQDNGYGRIDRDHKFMAQVDEWRKQYGGYNVSLESPPVGHLVPDHDFLAGMLKAKRDAWPKQLVWTQSDNVLKRFYWLEATAPVAQGHIEAKVDGNTITLKTQKQDKIALWLDSSLVDISKPVTVVVEGGKKQVFKPKPSLETFCEGLEQTSDPHLSAPVRIEVTL